MTLVRTLTTRNFAARLARRALSLTLLVAAAVWALQRQYGVVEVHTAKHPRHFPLALAAATGDDWPTLRGPAGNNSVARDGLAASLASPSRPAWRVPIPGGPRGGPCLRAGRVFLPVVDPQQQAISLWAFESHDGQLAWKSVLHRDIPLHRSANLGNGVPACDGQSVFLGAVVEGRLLVTAVDLHGGVRWTTDAGPFRAENGRLISPLLFGPLVIVSGEHRGARWGRWPSTSHLTALHRQTGDIVWRVSRPNSDSTSTPALADFAGRTHLVLVAPGKICGYDPATGELSWSCRWEATRAADAIAWDDQTIFAASREPRPQIVAVRLAEDGKPHLLWQSDTSGGTTMGLCRDALGVIALSDTGQLSRLDAESGKIQWRRQLPGDYIAPPLLAGGELFCASFQGIGSVVQVRQRGKSLVEQPLCEGVVAPMAATSRQLFLRTPSALICWPWEDAESPLVNAPGKPRKQL